MNFTSRAYYDNDYACMILHTTADIQDRNGGRGLGWGV